MDVLILIAALCNAQTGYTNASTRVLECQHWYLICYDKYASRIKGKIANPEVLVRRCIMEKE